MSTNPHIPANPLRRERLIDLAKFRKPEVTPEASSPLVEAEVQQSTVEMVSGGESNTEPGQ